jgi:hypothetical protein
VFNGYGSMWRNLWKPRPKARARGSRTLPRVEQLECRLTPAMFAVNVSSSMVQAGQSFILTVQAEDSGGNPISMSGTVNLTTTDPQVPTLPPITLSSNGFGYAADNLLTVAGSPWTITATSGAVSGVSGPVQVTPADPVHLAFGTQPTATATGNVINPAVTVNLVDLYGNVVTSSSESSDSVTLGVGSGSPGSFTAGSITTVNMVNGVASFSNLTLVVPGAYTLSAAVPAKFVGPNSSSFNVAPLQVLPGTFASTPSGFSVQFNAPFLVNSVTPVLFGAGFGVTAPFPTVSLTGPSGAVEGSVILDTAHNSLTFLETDTANVLGNGLAPQLPDGTYTVDITSSAAHNGLQAINAGGGFLDGLSSGTPGSGDFKTTFTINLTATNTKVVWAPATANGPGQVLNAPGNNQIGGGYPLYLSDTTGTVSSVLVTLNYNSALLNVTGVTGPGFSLVSNTVSGTSGQAVVQYSGATLAAGTQTPIGFLTATVPAGTTTNQTPYKAKDVLHLSGLMINGSSSQTATVDGLHEVAYVGDGDGNGSYSSNDAVLITRVALQTDSGFTAYPLVDPVIVADTDGSGFIPADAALQANEAGVGFPTANLPNPPVPMNVHFQPIANNVDPALSIPSNLQVAADGTLAVPVNIDDPHPEGSTGLIEAHLALTYDPQQFSLSAADIHLGSVLAAGSGWSIVPTINPLTGEIAIALSSITPISAAVGGSLVTIDFHQVPGTSPRLTSLPVTLVASVNPTGADVITTELEDAQGTFTLSPTLTNSAAAGPTVVMAPAASPLGVLAPSSTVFTGIEIASEETLVPVEENVQVIAAEPAVTEASATHGSPAVHAPVTTASAASAPASLLPLTGLVFQVAGLSIVSLPSMSGLLPGQHLADQFFQILARATGNPESVLGSSLNESLAMPSAWLRSVSAAEDGDLFGQDSFSSDLHTRPDATTPAPARPAMEQASSMDRTALDQVFAQTDDDPEPSTDPE